MRLLIGGGHLRHWVLHVTRVLLLVGIALHIPHPIAPDLSALRFLPLAQASEVVPDVPATGPYQEAQPGLEVVRAAFDLLRARYVQPIEAGSLIAAARGPDRSRGEGGTARGPDASLATATVDALWESFASGYPASVLAVPDGGNPAHVAVRRMTQSLDDCHTSFSSNYERDSSALLRSDPYGGIGVVIRSQEAFVPQPPGPVVTQIFANGPASKSGLHIGDAILAVDGVTVSAVGGSLTERVRGTPGTPVNLRIDRPGARFPLDITVVRGEVVAPLVDARIIPTDGIGPVGIVRLQTFAQPAFGPFADAINRMRDQGVRAWIVDLRENGGGDVGIFERIASLFISEGPLARTVSREGTPRTIRASSAWQASEGGQASTRLVDGIPVAVLVGRNTASAAELLAGDLEDYRIGRLFGETTAGCFGTSRIYRLPDGSGVWITVSTLQTGIGHRDVHRVGLEPAVTVLRTRNDMASGQDPVVDRAVEWLRTRVAASVTTINGFQAR
ncbi:MAG: PDZ domain-containing protein [Chloroflexi bacterium]|nr:PDZ domain-containing protein [Chloroflexota bacterium]